MTDDEFVKKALSEYTDIWSSPAISNIKWNMTPEGSYTYNIEPAVLRYSSIISSDSDSSIFRHFVLNLISEVISGSRDETPESKKAKDVSRILNKKWIVQREDAAQASFYHPVFAFQFFRIGRDIDLSSESLILNDAELTFNYYMSLIDDFLRNYVVLRSIPSTKIKRFSEKYLSQIIPKEYEGLNILVYSKSKGCEYDDIHYICKSSDLERTKKLLREEVEREESIIDPSAEDLEEG